MLCKKGVCFICNSGTVTGTRAGVDLFENQTTLKSSKKLFEAVSEILNKPVVQEKSHTTLLCPKCLKIIIEYDCLSVRCETLQTNLIEDFKTSLIVHDLDYDTYNVDAEHGKNTETINIQTMDSSTATTESVLIGEKKTVEVLFEEKKENIPIEGKRLVLPASKLQPLPPNFLFNSGSSSLLKQLSAAQSNVSVMPTLQPIAVQNSNGNIALAHPMQRISVPIGNKKLSPPKIIAPGLLVPSLVKINNTNVATNVQKNAVSAVKVTNANSHTSNSTKKELSSLLKFTESNTVSNSESVYTLNVTSLPNNFLSQTIKSKIYKDSLKDEDHSDGENADDSPMEIDESSFAIIKRNQYMDVHLNGEKCDENKSPEPTEEYVKLMPSEEIIQILEKQDIVDGEEHTIVMEGENCPIIRVVASQKLMIGDKEISLVIPGNGRLRHEDDDSRESNDDAQIELQVSGDEETANAIIAAAQEQGGAFIKVESGEMYRVESVQSREDSGDDDENSTGESSVKILRKGDGTYRCLFCEKYFKPEGVFEGDAASMMYHLKTSHGARIYICHVCGKFNRRKADYVTHISEHADSGCRASDDKTPWQSRVHECRVCHRKFGSRALLTEHSNVHAGARPYVCSICHKDFASKYTHQAHVKTHADRPRPYKCTKCEKSFFTQQNLIQHEKTHSGIREFICNVCNKAFGTQHNLEVHGVVHSRNKPFACHVCSKSFARRAELRDHVRIHTGERPFVCDICGARFTQRSNLHSHRRATHMNDKRYCCDRCPKRFKRRRLLDYHIKASHTGERPLVCDVCQATFVYPEHLKKHARVHSGARPYVCEICGKSFNSRDNRNTHRFVHSDRKPYECLVCGAGYMRKQQLYQHMNTRCHMAESIVVNQPRVAEHSDASMDGEGDKSNEPMETIIEAAEETAADSDKTLVAEGADAGAKYYIAGNKQIILEDGKSIDIGQDGEATLFTIHNIDGELNSDRRLLETVTVEQLDDSQTVGGDGSALMRLVQVQLADGDSGWVAVDD